MRSSWPVSGTAAALRTGEERDELLHFEELPLGGEWTTRRRTITQADLVAFMGLSGDYNPLYADAEFARTGHFGEPVAPAGLIVAVAGGLGAMDVPLPVAVGLVGMSWRFCHPVRVGDTLHCRWRLNRKRDVENPRWGLAVWQVEVENQHGQVVATAEYLRLVSRLAAPARHRRRRADPHLAAKPSPGPLPLAAVAEAERAPEAPAEPQRESRSRRRRRARPEPTPVEVAASPGAPPGEPEAVPAEPAPTAEQGARPRRRRRRPEVPAEPPPQAVEPEPVPTEQRARPRRRRRRAEVPEPPPTVESPTGRESGANAPAAPAEEGWQPPEAVRQRMGMPHPASRPVPPAAEPTPVSAPSPPTEQRAGEGAWQPPVHRSSPGADRYVEERTGEPALAPAPGGD